MTNSEENYLKVIYHLMPLSPKGVSTNAIASTMETKASSVTDMLKKLSDKKLVSYQKYQGVVLTDKGKYEAKMIVRKHRLWEVFLVEKLGFKWDEVHDIAEELEHIKSEKLINQLDIFLGFPASDPHGDPIPNKDGEIINENNKILKECLAGELLTCTGVKDSSAGFLKFLNKHQIALGSSIKIISKEEFDGTIILQLENSQVTITEKIANNLYVK